MLRPSEEKPSSRCSKIEISNPVAASDDVQNTVESLLGNELDGAIWCDPDFFRKALPCSDDQLQRVLDQCEGLNPERTAWISYGPSDLKATFYEPTLNMMNAIGHAVHAITQDGAEHVRFQNYSERQSLSDNPATSTYPHIIWCERPDAPDKIQWQDLDMFVEVQRDRIDMDKAIEQSAQHACTLLWHRFDRRFIKTLVIYGTVARFPLFDRCGLVYSDEVDIYAKATTFIQAFSGLLLLKGTDAGYNTMFRNLWGQDSRGMSTRFCFVIVGEAEYEVAEVLYNRKAIRSRATLVLALREPLDSNHPPKLALKLSWRDPTRFREGLILSQFHGAYGLAQVRSEGDLELNGKQDAVYSRVGLYPSSHGGLFDQQETIKDTEEGQRADSRILSWTLIGRGRPLKEASSPFELVAGMTGALMGHWALVNSEVQHRDISLGNILLAPKMNTLEDVHVENPNAGYEHTTHEETKNQHVGPERSKPTNAGKEAEWDQLKYLKLEDPASEFEIPDWAGIFNAVENQSKYERVEDPVWKFDPSRRLAMLKQVVEKLGRDEPYGILSDLDMANILSIRRDQASDMHIHRTGTLPFMAIKLLRAEPDERVPHTYVHDLESFFWVLLYVVANHRDGDTPLNQHANRALGQLDIIDAYTLGATKQTLLLEIEEGRYNVRSFETSWAEALSSLVQQFAGRIVHFRKLSFDSTEDPDAHFEEILHIFLKALSSLRPQSV